MRDDVALAAGFVLAGLGTLGTTALLMPVRDHPVGPTFAVAALALVVATSTALSGPVAGAMATLTAVLSFDFLFIPPYLDLKVGNAADRWPIVALVIVGGGCVAARRRAASVPSARSIAEPNPSRHVDRVERLIDQRTDPRDLVLAVEAELTALLAARRCRFEPGESSAARPRLERSGSVVGHRSESTLPPVELELPVLAGVHRIGCYVIDPSPDAFVPIAHRITALILTDHLGRALAAHKSPTTHPLT